MSVTRRDLLRWQFELNWSLFELHLDALKPEDFRWEPAPLSWNLREDETGAWVPDWQVPEPDPIPVPTIAWVTWHLGWWWSVTLDHVQGRTPREREEIVWPGAGEPTITWLRGLRDEWVSVLDSLTDAELDEIAAFPWPDNTELTVAHMIAWVNTELVKNVAEIGQLRLLRAAR